MDGSSHTPRRLLLLGGSMEASALGHLLANDAAWSVTLSLAGRTRSPVASPLAMRSGGFGGAEGLVAYLIANRIDTVVDATHPFASRMTANAIAAARRTGVKLLLVRRPEWAPMPGDRWILVPDATAAVAALGEQPRRVLLTIGQRDLAPFAAAPAHSYVIRSVEPPHGVALPPDVEIISARGPFAVAEEKALLRRRRISIIVTKNSGGTATYAKLEAARMFGLPVIMLVRPQPPDLAHAPHVDTVADVEQALRWLHRTAAVLRGV